MMLPQAAHIAGLLFSLNDKMSEILSTIRGKLIFVKLMKNIMGGNKNDGKKGKKMEAMGFEVTPEMMSMMGGFTVLRLVTLMGGMMAEGKITKEMLLDLNAKLNKIRKPRKFRK